MRSATSVGVLLLLAAVGTAVDVEDFYFWNYLRHPYQTYYLEDYCGPAETTTCATSGKTIYLNHTGSGSAAIVRGFRKPQPHIERSLKCCLNIKTLDLNNLNVHLDEVFLRTKQKLEDKLNRAQQKLEHKCDNFLRIHAAQIHGTSKDPGAICDAIGDHAFGSLKNRLGIEYDLSSANAPEFEKVKLVVTSASNSSALNGGKCAAADQYACDNSKCIWQGFVCDAQNNCGDWSDEYYCGFFARNLGLILGLSCGVAVIAIGTCVYCCCCRKKGKVAPQGFTFGKTAPNRVERIYPTLDISYQNTAGVHGAPPPPPSYTETQRLVPPSAPVPYNPNYGTGNAKA